MKTCICCGTKADADARTCANCGEGSWSTSQVVVLRPKDEPSEKPVIVGPKETDAGSTVPENFSPPAAIVDPDTAIEVPRVRRGKKQ